MAHTHTQPHEDKIEQNRQLQVFQRICLVIACHNQLRYRKGVFFFHHGVSTDNSQFIYRVSINHVTVVDDTIHSVLPGTLRGNQYIIVIAIVVDHTLPYMTQLWLGAGQIVLQESPNQGLFIFLRNCINQAFDNLGRLRQVPVKFSVCRRMVETAEGSIQFPEKQTQTF